MISLMIPSRRIHRTSRFHGPHNCHLGQCRYESCHPSFRRYCRGTCRSCFPKGCRWSTPENRRSNPSSGIFQGMRPHSRHKIGACWSRPGRVSESPGVVTGSSDTEVRTVYPTPSFADTGGTARKATASSRTKTTYFLFADAMKEDCVPRFMSFMGQTPILFSSLSASNPGNERV